MAQTLIDFSGLFLKVYLNDGTNEYMRVRNTDFSMAAYTDPEVIYIKRQGNTICQVDGDVDAVRYGATDFADMLSQLETEIAAIPPEGGGGGGGNVVDTLTATLGAGNTTSGEDISISANDKIIFPIDGAGTINSWVGGSWGLNLLADATIIWEVDNNLQQIRSPYLLVGGSGLVAGIASTQDGIVAWKNGTDASEVTASSPTTKQLQIDNTGHDVEMGINGAAVNGISLYVTGTMGAGTVVADTLRSSITLEIVDNTTTITQPAADTMLLTASAGVQISNILNVDEINGKTVSGTVTLGDSAANNNIKIDEANGRIDITAQAIRMNGDALYTGAFDPATITTIDVVNGMIKSVT